MEFSPKKINTFLFFKLPSAWWCGIRVKTIEGNTCSTQVTHTWINQNPFRSMFWAVQGMAAELSTGVLLMKAIGSSKHKVSMLVVSNTAVFYKKATGKITFTTADGHKITEALQKTIATGAGETFWMESTGTNQVGEVVSVFKFEWSVRCKV